MRLSIQESSDLSSKLDQKGKPEVISSHNIKTMYEIEDSLCDMVKTSYGSLGGWKEIETPEGLKNRFSHFSLCK